MSDVCASTALECSVTRRTHPAEMLTCCSDTLVLHVMVLHAMVLLVMVLFAMVLLMVLLIALFAFGTVRSLKRPSTS